MRLTTTIFHSSLSLLRFFSLLLLLSWYFPRSFCVGPFVFSLSFHFYVLLLFLILLSLSLKTYFFRLFSFYYIRVVFIICGRVNVEIIQIKLGAFIKVFPVSYS